MRYGYRLNRKEKGTAIFHQGPGACFLCSDPRVESMVPIQTFIPIIYLLLPLKMLLARASLNGLMFPASEYNEKVYGKLGRRTVTPCWGLSESFEGPQCSTNA